MSDLAANVGVEGVNGMTCEGEDELFEAGMMGVVVAADDDSAGYKPKSN